MADVFTVLAQDHQEVKAMLAELERGPTKATGATEDQLALRKKMTEQLILEESKHEALEEMYFWPAVRDRDKYHEFLVLSMIAKGYCSRDDGEELVAKKTSDFSEHYDVFLGDGFVRRGEGTYRSRLRSDPHRARGS